MITEVPALPAEALPPLPRPTPSPPVPPASPSKLSSSAIPPLLTTRRNEPPPPTPPWMLTACGSRPDPPVPFTESMVAPIVTNPLSAVMVALPPVPVPPVPPSAAEPPPMPRANISSWSAARAGSARMLTGRITVPALSAVIAIVPPRPAPPMPRPPRVSPPKPSTLKKAWRATESEAKLADTLRCTAIWLKPLARTRTVPPVPSPPSWPVVSPPRPIAAACSAPSVIVLPLKAST